MKKASVVLALMCGMIVGIIYLSSRQPAVPASSGTRAVQSPSPVEEKRYAPPQRLMIPTLDVDAPVEHVGLDAEKKMDVPKEAMNAAWYMLGAKPGEIGSAVLAGHFDKVTGAPAVFYRLGELEKGDEVQIEDETGQLLTFEVTDKVTYPHDNMPLEEIFAGRDGRRLNLITCEGAFDNSTRLYSHRTVIYATLREQ